MRKHRYSRAERQSLPWVYLFLLPTLILFITFYLVPIITVFTTSLSRWDGFNAPKWNGFTNYVRLFSQDSFMYSLKNLFWWSIIASTVHVGFGVLIAYLLYEKPKGWKFVRAVFMIPNVISVAAWAMIYKFVFNNEFGVLNTLVRFFVPSFSVNWFYESPWAFWAVTITWVFYAVIVTLIVLGDLMAIPKELLEASQIDGASGWKRTKYIMLPLCRTSIGTSVILSVTSRIAMYESIALTTRGGPADDTMNLSLVLVRYITDYNYGMANATAVIMFLIGIAVLFVINKIFRMNDPLY